MADLNVPDGMALVCRTCRWRPAENLPIGLLAAHFDTEHHTSEITLELVVLCPRCDKPMTHEATVGRQDFFACPDCKRSRTIRRAA